MLMVANVDVVLHEGTASLPGRWFVINGMAGPPKTGIGDNPDVIYSHLPSLSPRRHYSVSAQLSDNEVGPQSDGSQFSDFHHF